jgi:uncharacterized protein involved in exopolysaccharide biosynthesis
MTRRDLLAFLFRYKGSILGWWLFVVALVTWLVYALPQGFEAESRILVERTRAPVVTAREFNAPEMDEAMNTEVEILGSRPVIEAAVSNLGLDKPSDDEAAADQGPSLSHRLGDFLLEIGLRDRVSQREAWIELLSRQLKAAPVVDSNVLSVTYGSSDPLLAMKVVNAVTDAYIAHRRGIYAPRGASDYFKTRMEEAGQQLAELREQLAAYRADVSGSAMVDSQAELVRQVGTLRERIVALRAERADLLSRFAAEHPRVVVATQNLAAAERELAARDREITELDALQTRIGELNGLIENQESVFLDYKSQYEQELARESAPEDLVNARVIAYAALPAKPKHSRLFYIQLAIAGGLVVGFLVAAVRVYFDNRALDPDQVEEALGVPVLASIPRSRTLRRR